MNNQTNLTRSIDQLKQLRKALRKQIKKLKTAQGTRAVGVKISR